MGWFIGACVCVLIAAVALFIGIKADPDASRDEEELRGISFIVAGLFSVIGAIVLFQTLYVVVPPRNTGIVVTYGRPEGSVDNGWTWTKPWSTVENVDATIQTLTRDVDTNNPVIVRLGNQTTANVDLTVQWHIDQKDAVAVWQKYRGNDPDALIATIQAKVVERQLTPAVNRALEKHDPLGAALAGQNAALSYKDASEKIAADLRTTVDQGVVVDSVAVQFVHYDGVTQEKLNTYAQSLADTRIATQRVQTAEQQRLANEKLATSGSTTNPGVLYLACINMVLDLGAKGQLQNLPPAFQCSMNPTPVIVSK
jgi:regulator of protease activity HflC (stomatin/prohibitin superfamily)